MHPSRYALLRGPTVPRAPENDQGAEFEDPDDDFEDTDIGAEDEPEEEPDEVADYLDPEPEPDEEPVRTQRKPFSQRVEEVASRKVAETEARIRAELEARFAQQNQPARETQQQLNERLAQMEPWERAETISRMTADNVAQQLASIRAESDERADRLAYEGLKQRLPAAAKYESEVETRLAEMRRGGTTAPREVVLKYVIGDKAVANASRATKRTQRSADDNRQRQTARPSGGRSDTAADRGGTTRSARDKRLEDYQL